ncbi:MAG: ribosomal protein S18-alanine N-acetyltransferase [Lachnospiraceae bacterium]|nr:ribosomal protein S18-alanine N-acetyltransferase [Lachnospiraceae bacterium]
MEIRIEPLQECYLDQVCALEEEVFSMPWHRESFQEMIEDKNACYLVALHQEEVVGACGLRNIVGDGEVTNVVTKKAYQNRGIGATLLNQLFSIGRTMGVEAYTLEVRVSNRPAIHLYQKLGFKEEGIRKNFYEKPREDALIMWKR